MGTWRGQRMVFILGSLFMILMIILYWDDAGGFSLYPPQDIKRLPVHPRPGGTTTTTASSTTTTTTPGLVPQPSSDRSGPPHKDGHRGGEERTRDGPREEEDGRRQEERKRRIGDVCSGKTSGDFPGRTRAFEQIPNRELDHLIVDDTHQIIYCYVPKVACTNWKRVMVVLSQSLVSPSSGKPYTEPQDIPADMVHNSSIHLTFAKANEDFYRQFGSVMLRRYGNLTGNVPETAADAFAAGLHPSFQQFITYLLDGETEKEAAFNEHWRQVYRLCHPCQVQYDFVGHLETLEADSEQLLRILGVDGWIHFPTGARNRTAASWERDWFARIPMVMREELYKLYRPDFELFGYPKPDRVL
ncbi:hypothetical protein NHX12_017604 [Muraenolepis orangiensis]|uniref:Carbohydrate sulfotransferase n=1 Tax=Muraenolepis orangiensis TaxID=630683 RepID=A0A9Q0EZT5_9TELE|nr:hypothetical protein NHX12_017604 [Muraenolepis orangiensis]